TSKRTRPGKNLPVRILLRPACLYIISLAAHRTCKPVWRYTLRSSSLSSLSLSVWSFIFSSHPLASCRRLGAKSAGEEGRKRRRRRRRCRTARLPASTSSSPSSSRRSASSSSSAAGLSSGSACCSPSSVTSPASSTPYGSSPSSRAARPPKVMGTLVGP
ncbi:hypothetical protein EJB05_10994, partial [Eragrostis curvula]